MTRDARFVIEEMSNTPSPRGTAIASAARRATAVLPWVELAFLLPSKLLAAVGWLAVPLFIFAVVPVALLGTLLLAQAPIFFLLWKLFGGTEVAGDGCSDENSTI